MLGKPQKRVQYVGQVVLHLLVLTGMLWPVSVFVYLEDAYLNLFFVILVGGPLVILISCMSFLQSCLEVKHVNVNSFSLVTAMHWNSLTAYCFPLLVIQAAAVYLELTGAFYLALFNQIFCMFLLLFFITPCFVVVVPSCIEKISVKKCHIHVKIEAAKAKGSYRFD